MLHREWIRGGEHQPPVRLQHATTTVEKMAGIGKVLDYLPCKDSVELTVKLHAFRICDENSEPLRLELRDPASIGVDTPNLATWQSLAQGRVDQELLSPLPYAAHMQDRWACYTGEDRL